MRTIFVSCGIFLAILTLLTFPVIAFQEPHSVRTQEQVLAGDELSTYVALQTTSSGWTIQVGLPDLGIESTREFTSERNGHVNLYLPESTPLGTYVVRTVIKPINPEGKRIVRHRFVEVKDSKVANVLNRILKNDAHVLDG